MSHFAIAAIAVVAGGGAAGFIALFIGRGKLINEWRDYCADHAKANMHRYQQFDLEQRYVYAEFARIATEFENQERQS